MSDAPWLDDMLADVGVHEIAGPKANPRILQYFADVGHSECKSDEIAWCAARTGAALVHCGYPIPPVNVNLMARSYLTYGVHCDPKPGAIVIFPRGDNTWEGHVGVVVEVKGANVKFIAGNQSDAVGYSSRKISDALDFRWPVQPTVPALRAAGSTEIAKGDTIQKAGIVSTVVPIVGAVATSLTGPTVVPSFADVKEGLSWWQEILGGANAVWELALSHPWVAGTALISVLCYLVGREIKNARVAKAAAGAPLSAEVAKLGAA